VALQLPDALFVLFVQSVQSPVVVLQPNIPGQSLLVAHGEPAAVEPETVGVDEMNDCVHSLFSQTPSLFDGADIDDHSSHVDPPLDGVPSL
jgi:hypothetical protein